MIKGYLGTVGTILRHTDRRTLLEQLAEEAAELSQAALKLIRAEKLSNNMTPLSIIEVRDNLIEELADVEVCCELLGLNNRFSSSRKHMIAREKLTRWADRLEEESK